MTESQDNAWFVCRPERTRRIVLHRANGSFVQKLSWAARVLGAMFSPCGEYRVSGTCISLAQPGSISPLTLRAARAWEESISPETRRDVYAWRKARKP